MAGSSELEAVFLVILLHKADEGALVARGHPARVIEEPRFEVVMQRMKIPAAIVLAEVVQSFVSQVILRFIGLLGLRTGGALACRDRRRSRSRGI